MSLELAISEVSKEKQVAIKNSFKEFLDKATEYSKIIDGITIKNVDDREGLKNAREARLFLKNQRGEAKRLTDGKRNEIKAVKLEYDLADKAWLKSFQFVEGVFKELESKAEEKEKYVELLEAQRKEEVRKKRWEQLSVYMDFEPSGLDIMTDDVFGHILNGAKAEQEAKLEAERKAEEERLENERKDKLKSNREVTLRPYYQFFDEGPDLREVSDKDFQKFLNDLKAKKEAYDAEQEAIRKENERLKKEREAEQAKLKAEQDVIKAKKNKFISLLLENGYKETVSGRYVKDGYDVDEERLKTINEKEFYDRLKEVDEKIKIDQSRKAKEDAERKAKEAEIAKYKAELEAEKKRQEEIANKEKEAELARKKAEKEAMKAPDKEKIRKAVESLVLPELNLKDGSETYDLINQKFNGFKKWANEQINNI